MTRRVVLTACAMAAGLFVAGCATSDPGDGSLASLFVSTDRQEAVVSEAQACAIGYDLARAIHDTVSLRRTVIVAPTRSSPCERHALNYLRLAGFRIDQKAAGDPPENAGPKPAGVTLDIELTRFGNGGFAADNNGGSPAGKNGGSAAGEGGGKAAGGDTVSAVARLGRGLTIARSYRPAHTGVVALGPVSIQHLDPDTYATRPASSGGGGAS